jgi:hypothetical protein
VRCERTTQPARSTKSRPRVERTRKRQADEPVEQAVDRKSRLVQAYVEDAEHHLRALVVSCTSNNERRERNQRSSCTLPPYQTMRRPTLSQWRSVVCARIALYSTYGPAAP